jgi:hypothetical protein
VPDDLADSPIIRMQSTGAKEEEEEQNMANCSSINTIETRCSFKD